MKLLKPAVAALVAAGLVGSAFAASGSYHHHKYSARKYSHVSAKKSCGSSVVSAAVGNSYHAMNCASSHVYGDASFAIIFF